MARILFGRADGAISPELFSAHHVSVPADGQVVAFLDPIVAEANRRHPGAMSVQVIGADTEVPVWHDPAASEMAIDLDIALAPMPDRRYQRWSFSAIVDRVAVELADPTDDSMADAGAADEAEAEVGLDVERGDAGEHDEPGSDAGWQGPTVPDAAVVTSTILADVNPMADLAGGTTFGTLVHSVLERTDWQAPDLDVALGDAVDECMAWRPVELVSTVPSQTGNAPGLVWSRPIDRRSAHRASHAARTTIRQWPTGGSRALATASPSSPSTFVSAPTATCRAPDCWGRPSAMGCRQTIHA